MKITNGVVEMENDSLESFDVADEIFEKMAFEVGKKALNPTDDLTFIKQYGAAKLLVGLMERTGIDPIAVAADALEDINYHDDAAALRAML